MLEREKESNGRAITAQIKSKALLAAPNPFAIAVPEKPELRGYGKSFGQQKRNAGLESKLKTFKISQAKIYASVDEPQ